MISKRLVSLIYTFQIEISSKIISAKQGRIQDFPIEGAQEKIDRRRRMCVCGGGGGSMH